MIEYHHKQSVAIAKPLGYDYFTKTIWWARTE